ncbi:MAG TPA: FAD-dependent monooxygenase [Acidimicrobiia bacterium]|jgi:2-polyprenyl-6-methoxyphenol hydroxylase-like FAD-dependent oxidoreductase
MSRTDVVIVGGGIAGSALAAALAREGLGVVVLEATDEYEDRVRGETMMPWGVAEARALGLEQPMLDAGAQTTAAWVGYHEGMDPAEAEAAPLPVGSMVPGVAGCLNLRHPEACAVLAGAASAAGADVRRGVRDIEITLGDAPHVRWRQADTTSELDCRLVVGADGRASVVRRALGIELEKQPATDHIAGLLVAADGMPDAFDFFGGAPDQLELGFRQRDGYIRMYLVVGESGRQRFAGAQGARAFLDACRVDCVPFSAAIAAGEIAGPCATYPGTETWCDRPFGNGAVLVGDAAGHSNPIIGQGLSIAMRDARVVGDAVRGGEWRDFSDYGAERLERMRRIRLEADIVGAVYAEDTDQRLARHAVFAALRASDERMFSVVAAIHGGPEVFPSEVFDPELLDLVRV